MNKLQKLRWWFKTKCHISAYELHYFTGKSWWICWQ